jgi:hypothetical protein
MTTQEILISSLNKTQKAYKLYSLGHTRTQVSEWITNGNYGFAHNIYKKWLDQQNPIITSLPFEYNFNRTFGIELEVYGASRESLIREITRAGIQIEGQTYNHRTSTQWKIVSDSSISGANGNEIVSPVLTGLDGMEQIKKICIGLNRAGAKINNSCGFHVHFGANDFNLDNFKNLLTSFTHLEEKFDDIIPASRRANNNSFCKNISSITAGNKITTIQKINSATSINSMASSVFGGGRYYKLNVQSFLRYGTVEFRQHSGTTQFSKIKNWILICGRLVEYAKQNGVTNDFNSFLNESLQDYVSDRAVDLVA